MLTSPEAAGTVSFQLICFVLSPTQFPYTAMRVWYKQI